MGAQAAAGQGGMADRQSQRQEAVGGNQQNRQDAQAENREGWQNQRDKNREAWQDWAEDQRWDSHWHGYGNTGAAFVAGTAVGAAAAATARTYVTTLPCSYSTIVINGTTYYRCGATWYSRGYVNGSVTYVVVSPPPGY